MINDEESGCSSSSLNCSQTPPKRKKTRDKTCVESPYFSPRKKTLQAQRFHSNIPLNNPTVVCKNEGTALEGSMSVLLERLYNVKPCLIQEKVADDPWKLLVAVTLLNKTTGKLALPVFRTIIEKFPTPLHLSQAHVDELATMINHLGLHRVRAKRLIDMSRQYLLDPPSIYDPRRSRLSSSPQRKSPFFGLGRTPPYPPTPISHLPGAGTYALDSYRIFCSACDNPLSEEWKSVMPTDKELIRYLKWKWASVENIEWSPTKGAIRRATAEYLITLIANLENTALS